MFAGLILTSISTLTLRAALFQRKSRSGWLEELDGIREDALVTPGGAVDDVVDAGDIWTDLREGGSYEDPHEISSLYATDETPDLPAPKARPAKARARKARSEDAPAAAAPPATAPPAPGVLPPPPAATVLPPPPAASVLPPPPPPTPSPAAAPLPPVHEDAPIGTDVVGLHDAEPVWVQPAPHPIRPSEMWHPADLAPPTIGDEAPIEPVEERIASADLADERPADPFAHLRPLEEAHDPFAAPPVADVRRSDAVDLLALAPIDQVRASELETELAAAADLTVLDDAGILPIDTPSEGGLVPGPVGRRVRRDRPALPQDHLAPPAPADDVAPLAPAPAISPDRGDVSPLPPAPLPPAALPTRAPAASAPSPSPAEVSHPAADAAAPAAVEPAPPAPAAAHPIAPEPAPAVEAVALAPSADGLLAVPGTIVRVDGAHDVVAALEADGAHVALAAGWTWVSPADGEPAAVHVEVPTALVSVHPGATALVVVEAEHAAFVFVADGTVEVRRPDGVASLGRGSIAMLDPSGAAQVDQASDDELASDPIVAQNLALDAEL